MCLLLFGALLSIGILHARVAAAPAADYAVVALASKQQAASGERILITFEVLCRGEEAMAPIAADIRPDFQFIPTGDGLIYTTGADSKFPRPKQLLKRGQKLAVQYYFTAPEAGGVYVIGAIVPDIVPVAIQVSGKHVDEKRPAEGKATTLKEIGDAIKVLPNPFERVPNQAAQSTTTTVTPPAGQEARQP